MKNILPIIYAFFIINNGFSANVREASMAFQKEDSLPKSYLEQSVPPPLQDTLLNVSSSQGNLQQGLNKEEKDLVLGGSLSPNAFNRFENENSLLVGLPGVKEFIEFLERVSLGYRLLLFLALFSFSFLSSIVFVVVVFVTTNWNMNRKKNQYTNTRKYVIEVLSPLLLNIDEVEKKEQELVENTLQKFKGRREKQVVIDVLMEASRNLTGNSTQVLTNLYDKLNLNRISLSSLHSLNSYKKAMGIRELAYLSEQAKEVLLTKYLNTNNLIVRQEAVLSHILIEKGKSFDFLNQFHQSFTRWIQLSAYYTMYFNGVQPPLLNKLLEHQDPQIVLWCLRLVAIYNQVEVTPNVEKCLFHESEDVRLVAVQTSLALENWEVKETLKGRYEEEPLRIRLEILKYIKNFAGTEDITFLSSLAKTGSFSEVREVVYILYNMNEESQNELYRINRSRSLSGKLDPFINHVIEPLNGIAV